MLSQVCVFMKALEFIWEMSVKILANGGVIMFRTRIVLLSTLFAVGVSVALILIFAGPTSAQNTANDNEEFRSQLADFTAELIEVYPYIAAAAPPNLLEDLHKAQQAIPLSTPTKSLRFSEMRLPIIPTSGISRR